MRRRLLLAAAAAACTTPPLRPAPPAGDEVTIFLHGIRGSFLVTEGPEPRVAWLTAADALSSGDRSLALPFPGERPAPAFGPLRPDGILTHFTVFPLVLERDFYLPFLRFGAERLPGFLPFAYDWRLDARDAAARLGRKVDALAVSRGGSLKVNLIGHSLGGLIALYYLRRGGEGVRHVRSAVFAGAPFRGAPVFLKDIVEGAPAGRNAALVTREAAFTFATEFQLLPYPGRYFVDETGRPLDLDAADPEAWRRGGWGVFADPSVRDDPAYAAQLERMLAAQRELREALADAQGEPPEVRALAVVGEGQPTPDRVRARGGKLDFAGSPTSPGDEDVPAASALPPAPLRFETVRTRAPHAQLLNDPAVQEAIATFVTRRPRPAPAAATRRRRRRRSRR